jgi:hypothetical protein
MEAKKASLENAIAGLRAALATGALGAIGVKAGDPLAFKDSANAALSPASISAGQPISLPRGAFLGKTGPDAIKMYLTAARRKQTNKEIAQALRDGGLESMGSIDNLVTNSLFRLKQDSVVLRFDDGWGLAEWYPESFRTRVAEKTANGGKKKKKGATRKAKTATVAKPSSTPKAAPAAPPAPAGPPAKEGIQVKIEDCFAAHSGTALSTLEIAEGLGMRIQTVSLICAKLAHNGKIKKTPEGKFHLAGAKEMPKAS